MGSARERFWLVGALVLVACLWGAAPPCWADKEEYLEAVPYFSLGQGETQLLIWNDWFEGLPRNQVEIQHGFTDRLSGAVYFVEQNVGQGSQYNSTQVEVRYKLARYKKFWIDPAIYVNYAQGAANTPSCLTTTLILSKDVGEFNITGNATVQKNTTGSQDLSSQFSYVVAVSYPLSKPTTWGLEYENLPQQGQSFLIPEIMTALSRHAWLNFGLQIDLQPSHNPINIRSIYSVSL